MANKPMFGSTEVSNFMAGSTQIDKVMVGSELVWSAPPAGLGCDPFGDGSGILYDKLDNALVNECGGEITGTWVNGDSNYCPDGLKGACACDFKVGESGIRYDLSSLPPIESTGYTVCCWCMYPSDVAIGDTQGIMGMVDGNTNRLYTSGDIFYFQGTGLGIGTPHNTDEWYFVCSTWADSVYTHYVNGVVVDGFTGSLLSDYGIHIGRSHNQSYIGHIDEVRYFNKALTLEEVEILYNDGVNT